MGPKKDTQYFTSFNPRPREGATKSFETVRISKPVSIHAPVKGRHDNAITFCISGVSIHAPVKGRQEYT